MTAPHLALYIVTESSSSAALTVAGPCYDLVIKAFVEVTRDYYVVYARGSLLGTTWDARGLSNAGVIRAHSYNLPSLLQGRELPRAGEVGLGARLVYGYWFILGNTTSC